MLRLAGRRTMLARIQQPLHSAVTARAAACSIRREATYSIASRGKELKNTARAANSERPKPSGKGGGRHDHPNSDLSAGTNSGAAPARRKGYSEFTIEHACNRSVSAHGKPVASVSARRVYCRSRSLAWFTAGRTQLQAPSPQAARNDNLRRQARRIKNWRARKKTAPRHELSWPRQPRNRLKSYRSKPINKIEKELIEKPRSRL